MKAKRRQFLAPALLLISCLFLSSCTDFKKAWAAETAKPPQKHSDLTGAWEGSWVSSVNGHNGKLRCIITKQKDGQYEFHYWAQWQKVLSGSFKSPYKVAEKNGKYSFSGDKDLGKLGGKFTHTGTATANTFKATYDSDMGDKGVFELKRLGAKTTSKKTEEKKGKKKSAPATKRRKKNKAD